MFFVRYEFIYRFFGAWFTASLQLASLQVFAGLYNVFARDTKRLPPTRLLE